MHGRNWLLRRAEQRLAPELGKLVYIASSSRIFWSWLLPCLIAGFIFGTIGQFITSANSSDHTPDRFQNLPAYLITCLLTGLVLWSLTLGMAFRKPLVFDGGMVASYAQARTTRIFRWDQVSPESIKAVTSQDGSSPTALLRRGLFGPLRATRIQRPWSGRSKGPCSPQVFLARTGSLPNRCRPPSSRSRRLWINCLKVSYLPVMIDPPCSR